jgi:hypothetical protein
MVIDSLANRQRSEKQMNQKDIIHGVTTSSYHIPYSENCDRWVEALFPGLDDVWMRARVQNETVWGYWVQFDPDGPYRLVEEIRED